MAGGGSCNGLIRAQGAAPQQGLFISVIAAFFSLGAPGAAPPKKRAADFSAAPGDVAGNLMNAT
jgi:hypothetical protein